MRIIIISELAAGGVERVNYLLAKGLKSEHEVKILSVRGEGSQYINDVNYIVLNKKCGKEAFRSIIVTLKKEKPDWVVACNHTATICALLYKYFYGKTSHCLFVVHSVYSSMFKYRRKSELILQHYLPKIFNIYNKCDAVVYVSRGVKCDFKKIYKIRDPKEYVIYNPVFNGMPKKYKTHYDYSDSIKIVSVGRLEVEKRQELLLYTVKILNERGINASLYLYGEGCLKEKLQKLSEVLFISDKVVFKGFSYNVIEELYQYDVFCLTSEFESFGNVIVEAMGAGVPVVSVDCPVGPREILDNGRYGVLVSDTAEKIAEGILSIVNNNNIEDMARKAHERAELFDLEKIIKNYREVIRG